MTTSLFPAAAADVLYLIDVSGYVFRAYHAIAPLSSPSGEPTQAVLGTVNMLERLVRQCKPHLLAVAMDSKSRTFRYEIYSQYKAHRPPPPPDLSQQMQRVQQLIDAFAIPVFQQDGVEADDLIATAVSHARHNNLRVVIVSADKDLMQLVGPDVLMWDTMRDRVIGVPEVHERFGVGPDQVRDFLALTGDSSDNIPGVPSVGPKTASDLLTQFTDIAGIYANLDKVQRVKLRETLKAHQEQALLSQRLTTLKADCPLRLDLEHLRYGGRDVARLRELYTELGFLRHLNALAESKETAPAAQGRNALAATESKSSPAPADEQKQNREESQSITVVNDTQLQDLGLAVQKAPAIALEIVTSSEDAMRCDLLGIALALPGGLRAYVPLGHRYVGVPKQLKLDAVTAQLGPALARADLLTCAHDLKHIQVVLTRHGLPLKNLGFDSLIAAYLLDPNGANTLEQLALGHFGQKLPVAADFKRGTKDVVRFDELLVEEVAAYGIARANCALQLKERLGQALDDQAMAAVYADIEQPLIGQLAQLELYGVLVDAKRLTSLGVEVEAKLVVLEKKAHEVAGKSFNVNSPRQLETILFDELGLKPLKRTKTSRSTDAATLEALAEEHELPAVILEVRQLSKLKGTYIDSLPQLVHPKTGRIHTRWDQAVAATGRLSSADPNLQNIPIRSELGRRIREAFIAPPGHVLLSADYSQIELRVLAHLSQDPKLLEAFRSGQDVHTRTALEIFGVKEKDLTAEHRRRAKAVNFGVIYGQGEGGLSKSLGISRDEAHSFIAAYFQRYQGVRHFMDATLERARAGDAVRTLFGRRRLIPDIKHQNRAVRLAAERVAMNTPIQGTAADLLKLAMIKLQTPVTPGTRMILTVHDELVFEVPTAEVDKATPQIKTIMETVHPLDVPLVVDIGHGNNWNEAH
ncbi:MAG TPA: DNA polymerase I [Polyangiaceae bacterium]|nr:DNA polymerase I [Polyangiaceae bacterium]